ncbi:MAG TPA: DUF805 domain-containing protein [Rhizomicrobium sp.]|jgi:uncharacterized membrane protein YhaH (DUF805 family)
MNLPLMIRDYLFGFKGRVDRELMWVYLAVAVLSAVVLMIASAVLGKGVVFLVIAVPLGIALLWSALAVGAKRRHDRDLSGMLVLILFAALLASFTLGGAVPPGTAGKLVNAMLIVARIGLALYLFVDLFVLKGTPGENDYGPDTIIPELDPNDPGYTPAGYSVKIDGAHQEFYYVAESNRERARTIVRDGRGAPDAAVTIMGTILHQTVAKLGLKPGEFVTAPRLSS